jgi:hypothetical protein
MDSVAAVLNCDAFTWEAYRHLADSGALNVSLGAKGMRGVKQRGSILL